MISSLRNLYSRANAQLKWLLAIAKEEKKTDELGFMADSDVKTLEGPVRYSHWILWVVFIFIMISLLWAKLAILDEVTVGHGKVIPSSQVQIIQNLEGGIVREILVKEGEVVQKGQILIRMDDVRFSSSYQEAQMKILALQVKIARLTAVVENTSFQVPPELEKLRPDLIRGESGLYASQQNELKQLQRNRELTAKELELTKPLVPEGAASEVELLRLERNIAEIDGQISNFYSKALAELNAAKGDLASSTESSLALADRLTRTVVRSPVKGIVKQLKVTTIGGVIQPGMDLLEIVPLEDTLLIEAKVKPADIGFLHPGLPAMVKITAYDFGIYGGLEGKLEQISADTITDEKGDSYYVIRVRTGKNYLGTPDKPLYIIPGMMATVDILTGRKSVLHYLLKPILKVKEKALHER